jgi:hypothetical protein
LNTQGMSHLKTVTTPYVLQDYVLDKWWLRSCCVRTCLHTHIILRIIISPLRHFSSCSSSALVRLQNSILDLSDSAFHQCSSFTQSQSFCQSVNHLVSKSISQSISQSVNQSIIQSVTQSINQSLSQPVRQSGSQWINQ